MADVRPLVLEDQGTGQAQLREMADSETVPTAQLGASPSGVAVLKGTPAEGRAGLGLGSASVEVIGTTGNAVGKLNSNNNWSGAQTFSNAATIVGAQIFVGRADPSTVSSILYLGFGSATTSAFMPMYSAGDGSTATAALRGTGGASGQNYSGSMDFYGTSFRPISDNVSSNGVNGRRWSVVWAATGTISTSDAREKTPVRKLTKLELDWAIALADELGAYQWNSSVDEKGNFARDHIGMTVQRAIELGESLGLEPYDYSFICYDQWPERTEVMVPARYETVMHAEEVEEQEVQDPDNEGETITVPVVVKEAYSEEVLVEEAVVQTYPAGERYSFRPDGLNAFIAAGIRANQRRLESRLEAIERALADSS